jgi:ferric-dicitrate binding protein FerR (iron transport regulator)
LSCSRRGYGELVADDAEIRRRQRRRADRALGIGALLMAAALLIAWLGLAPPLLTTFAAIAGFVLVSYAVHLAWLVFVNRESDGPPS